ncbi:MAG: chemotaxis protein CheB [Pseudomonadota bacterium]
MDKRPQHIIAVGASAGGLEPLRALLAPAKSDDDYCVVVVQHTSPDFKSLLPNLLQEETALEVNPIKDGVAVRGGCVYVVPAHADAVFRKHKNDGVTLHLIDKPPREKQNLPIDRLLQSLAEVCPESAVAVVLSGSGSDGSIGVRAVRDKDGVIVAQDPQTCAFDMMPRASIATGLVDLVLPPGDMLPEIITYLRQRTDPTLAARFTFSESASDLEMLERIARAAEIDFTVYKTPTLKRSILHRMSVLRSQTPDAYLATLREGAAEALELRKRFLVGVTYFFRDGEAWDRLDEMVVTPLLQRDVPSPIKIWSVGCSTGEEAYSLSMLFDWRREQLGSSRDFRVYATDANIDAVKSAKRGVYPKAVLNDIRQDFGDRYFTSVSDGLAVSSVLRQKTLIAQHDIAKTPPYINVDLIVCRNTLIYMRPALQSYVMRLFSYALNRDGLLFLGSSETVDKFPSAYHTVDKKHRIFRSIKRAKVEEVIDHERRQSSGLPHLFDLTFDELLPMQAELRNARPVLDKAEIISDILREFGACIIICDPQFHILETYGDLMELIRIRDGSFSANLQDLAGADASAALIYAAQQAAIGKEDLYRGQAAIRLDDAEEVDLNILCRRTPSSRANAHYIFVLSPENRSDAAPGERVTFRDVDANASSENLSGYTEELRATNEELVSTNEELQSANEELQAVNEELHVLSSERNEKILELEAANSDIENLLNGIDKAIAVLDDALALRLFNNAFSEIFGVEAKDVGRPLAHFASIFPSTTRQTLFRDMQLMLSGRAPTSHEVKSQDEKYYRAKIRPFESADKTPEGVVISFTDITEFKSLESRADPKKDTLEAELKREGAD